ncbi:MAG: DUF1684 domain-containing protein [Vicinamibacterales bacterium]
MQRAPVVTGALLAAAVAVLAGAAAGPVRLSPEQRAAVLKDIDKDRTETQAWLKSAPTSYLATISRRDFEGRPALTVGRAADNDIRVDDPAFEAHHLRVTVEGDRFRVDAVDPSARFVSDKTPARSAIVEPSMLDVGRFKLRLSHQGFPGIIVFDPQSPHFRKYKGLKYFPPNLDLRYELPLTRNPKPETIVILSTRGNQRRATRVGWFEFAVRGTPVKLEAVNLLEPGVPEDELGIFFRDATTGKESYPLGRYVDVKKLPDGRYLLDFNFTYNPACAYSDHYNCPIPPRTNVLPVAIDAGEMDAHYH